MVFCWVITSFYAPAHRASVVLIGQNIIVGLHERQNLGLTAFANFYLNCPWPLRTHEKLVHAAKNRKLVTVNIYLDVMGRSKLP
jgi:hypothetical protein